ncbi:hypothetical protein [Polymorphospora rubra]|uniref:hypothetical protein n=1 Tax=Polymorphospora rubra TaxID=338584 RepID=UPI00340B282D
MRFASYNLLDWTGTPTMQVEGERQQRVVDTIVALRADVLAVQELKGPAREAGRLAAQLGQRVGMTSLVETTVDGPVQAVAAGDNTLHVAVLWRPGSVTAVPGTLRRFGGGQSADPVWRGPGWGTLVRVGLDVGGRTVMVGSYHAPVFGRERRVDQAETVLGAMTRPAGPVLLGSDSNTVGAARRPGGGDFFDPDPYADREWFADLVHQCRWETDADGRRWHWADRRPAEVWELGGLHDTAVRSPVWQATTGHWPTCDYGRRGIARRIDTIHASTHVFDAVTRHAVFDTPLARAASDHLPVFVDIDLTQVTDGR